jgi:DNA polymerase III epsilon subunit-like protein
MTRLAFIDVETTGTDSRLHDIWEIGLVIDVDGRLTAAAPPTSWLIEPRVPMADPRSLAMNGFYDRAPKWRGDGLEREWANPRHVAMRLTQHMRDAIPANCNVHFDLSFLLPFVRQHGGVPSWHYSPIDVKSMAYGREADRPNDLPLAASTNTILELYGIKNDGPERHTALGDALLARDLFYAILGRQDYERHA